jgi:hypothetical protein
LKYLNSQKAERNGDIAVLLYAAPFIINFVYTLYLWAGAGFSSTLPQLVFLEVTQNPYVFLLGFAAVAFAAVLDFDNSSLETRRASVSALSRRLQAIAGLSLVLAAIAALYAGGGDLGTAAYNLLDGRYPLVFPAVLLFLSFVILPSFRLESVNRSNALVVIFLIASPIALYELGKRDTTAGLGVGLILLLLAAYILVSQKRE